MAFTVLGLTARGIAAAALGVSLVMALGARGATAQDKTYVMKIGTPTVNDTPEAFVALFAPMVEKDSGGRIKIELYSASKLGPMAREIEGLQFGSIECAIIPPEFFVGVDERFELMAAPGLVDSLDHGQRLAADPEVKKVMFGLGADKGLRGVAMFMNAPSSVIAKNAIRHVADFKGKKIRVLASKFQTVPIERLGATPVAMTLGDVVPALQQGAVDGAVGGIVVWTPMHFQDAAKYVTETGQPAVFVVVEISKKWYDSLPADLQEIVDRAAVSEATAINPQLDELEKQAIKTWSNNGGELIDLPADEQTEMFKILASVGADVVKTKPNVQAAYEIVTAAAQRAR